jgi:hypothetical protein
MRLEKQ